MYNSYNCHSYKKKLGKVAMGIIILDWCPCLCKKMDGAYKKLVYQMRRVLFGLLGLSPQNCNLGLKTAICIAILKGFKKKYHFENKTSTSQDNKLNFVFYLIKKYEMVYKLTQKKKCVLG